MGVIIREMDERDLRAVSELDAASLDMVWTESMYESDFRKKFAHYYTAEEDGMLIGYAGIWCVCETADVSRIAVKQSARRRGIGEALMKAIISAAARDGCESVMLEVNEHNTAARRLYEKLGFKEICVRKNYYRDGSAVVMGLSIGSGLEGADS